MDMDDDAPGFLRLARSLSRGIFPDSSYPQWRTTGTGSGRRCTEADYTQSWPASCAAEVLP